MSSMKKSTISNAYQIPLQKTIFFDGSDRFLVCKTDSICIKRIFFGPKKRNLRIIYWRNYLD